jgi:hypothetical protein
MKFLHQPFSARAKQRIEVSFNKPTRVLLIHESQFKAYKGGKTYKYRGGYYDESPVVFEVPSDGVWHAVIEKGTYRNPLDVTGSAKLKRPAYKTLNGPEQMETHGPVEEYDDTLE